MILGRTGIFGLQGTISLPCLKVKFATPAGIGEFKEDRETTGRCYGKDLIMAETDPQNSQKGQVSRKATAEKSLESISQRKLNMKCIF